MGDTHQFLSGAICMAYLVVGMFFLKFWRRTRDSFFLCFAASFFVFSFVRITLSAVSQESELRWFLYLGRALAVLMIVIAIVQKNRPKKARPVDEADSSTSRSSVA